MITENKVTDNPHFGRKQFSSNYERGFEYKEVGQYDAEEWLENIFIFPSENGNHLDNFSFMDKRSGVTFSRMGVGMPHEDIRLLANDPEGCRWLIKRYYEKRFYHASKSGSYYKVH